MSLLVLPWDRCEICVSGRFRGQTGRQHIMAKEDVAAHGHHGPPGVAGSFAAWMRLVRGLVWPKGRRPMVPPTTPSSSFLALFFLFFGVSLRMATTDNCRNSYMALNIIEQRTACSSKSLKSKKELPPPRRVRRIGRMKQTTWETCCL